MMANSSNSAQVAGPWAALAADLHRTTEITPGMARRWAQVGIEQGWTVEQTQRYACGCIAVGISPRELVEAMAADPSLTPPRSFVGASYELNIAARHLWDEIRKVVDWFTARLPGVGR